MLALRKQGLRLLYLLALRLRLIVWDLRRPTLIGVRALVVRDDQVLLIRHRGGKKPWGLPGGGVERHERLVEAARREVYEETGMPVHVERLLGVYDAFSDQIVNYVAVFVCRPQGEPRVPQSLEIEKAQYFPMQSLPADIDSGSGRRIQEYLDKAHGVSNLY